MLKVKPGKGALAGWLLASFDKDLFIVIWFSFFWSTLILRTFFELLSYNNHYFTVQISIFTCEFYVSGKKL